MRPLDLCAIVKDELAYLPEWIAYHRRVGVQRFFLYDNGSQVPLRSRPGVPGMWEGVVVIDYPGKDRQAHAYTDCLRRVAGKTRWLALLDVDEYLVPIHEGTLSQALLRWEGDHSVGGVAVHWQTFGSSGFESRPAGLQIERFRLRTPDAWAWNAHIKTIARPECVLRALDGHHMEYRKSKRCVNDRGDEVAEPMSDRITHEIFQVNHYFTRSRAEFQEKLRRGAPSGNPKPPHFFDVVNEAATVEDHTISRFIPDVRRTLEAWGIST